MSRLTTSLLRRAVQKPKMAEVPVLPKMTWKELRAFANGAVADKGEWGGAPIPIEGFDLIMEPRYPFKGIEHFYKKDRPRRDDEIEVRNVWFSYQNGSEIVVYREKDGISRAAQFGNSHGKRLEFWINTLAVAAGHAWDMDVENRAIEKLRDLVTPHALHCYQLTGSFLETSKRSHVTYLFRRLRPTLAMRPDERGNMQVIAVLCLHPLGYYAQTWAGAMCPTDDVVAHLMLMRGDEHGFWGKSNHHPMWMASAGI